MTLYQIDAFTDRLFGGNPAAVIPLDSWIPDHLMQSIAAENNLAETAFIVPEGNDFRIRWFTPAVEVDLCGHATLASAFVYFDQLAYSRTTIHFQSKSGLLTVEKNDDWFTMDFPLDIPKACEITPGMIACTNATILEAWKGVRDYMFVVKDVSAVTDSHFDLDAILKLGFHGLIVTAPGEDVDFVSRFFAPAFGIPEDPVTGSSHTTLTPYWTNRLSKNELTARQLSPRGGYLRCAIKHSRAMISGQATMYMKGKLEVSNLL